jgi:hypothetical protein
LDGDLFAGLLEVAGSGGGTVARVRRWSALVLAMAGVLGAIGLYFMSADVPVHVDAASIEDATTGAGLTSYNRWTAEVTGHILQADAVTLTWRGSTWICAPIVSGRPGSADHPRLYYLALEGDYMSVRAGGSYVGRLSAGIDDSLRSRIEAEGRSVPGDAYLLRARPFREAYVGSGRALVGIAFVVALAALFVFIVAVRRERQAAEP